VGGAGAAARATAGGLDLSDAGLLELGPLLWRPDPPCSRRWAKLWELTRDGCSRDGAPAGRSRNGGELEVVARNVAGGRGGARSGDDGGKRRGQPGREAAALVAATWLETSARRQAARLHWVDPCIFSGAHPNISN
jgi:hypothetical protein